MSIVSSQSIPTTKSFPKLMLGNSSGAVYLMWSATEGVVVSEGTSSNQLGKHRTDLAPDMLKDYNGSVTITNK